MYVSFFPRSGQPDSDVEMAASAQPAGSPSQNAMCAPMPARRPSHTSLANHNKHIFPSFFPFFFLWRDRGRPLFVPSAGKKNEMGALSLLPLKSAVVCRVSLFLGGRVGTATKEKVKKRASNISRPATR
nr:hypothetical protein [Pandoravirus massiliensis]